VTIVKPLLPYAAIFLLALGLRLYAIGEQSLWYDEGLTVALIGRAPADIVRAAAVDVHPPLYYLLLKGWAALFGTSEAAVRSLSAVCGALAALFTAMLGQRWFGARAGGLAGLAAAVSPLGVYYGQEARMYALAALLAVVLWLALDLWLVQASRRWLAFYALAALAGLLTHYFFVTIVAASGALGLLALVFGHDTRPDHALSRSGAVLRWVALHVALAAAYLPLVWSSRGSLAGWSATRETPGPALIAVDALRALALGPVAPLATMQWLPLFVLLLLAVGLWPAPVRPWQRAMALTWLLLPVAALAALSLNQPYYKPRFLLPVLPAFHLLLGAGVVGLAARVFPRNHADTQARSQQRPSCLGVFVSSCAVALLLAAAQPLLHTYFDPAARRDDYRGVARAIEAGARPGDALLLVGAGQAEPLGYYLHTPLALFPLPRARPLDPSATERELEQLAREHPRVYVVSYVPEASDPQRVIRGWLDQNAFRATSRWYGAVELAIYELGDLDAQAQLVDTQFGEGLTLLDARTGPLTLHPGDALRAELRWRADAQLEPLLVFAHLLDAQGQLVAQFDGPPATTGSETWAVGQEQQGRFAILVPPDAAPGTYTLVLGVYTPNGSRLTTASGGETVTVTQVVVLPERVQGRACPPLRCRAEGSREGLPSRKMPSGGFKGGLALP
jgi:mannosyltransferase